MMTKPSPSEAMPGKLVNRWKPPRKNATLHEVLVWQKVLSQFLQVPSEILSQDVPHACRVVLRSSRHGVNVFDHLQDGCIGGLVDELHAVRRIQDFL